MEDPACCIVTAARTLHKMASDMKGPDIMQICPPVIKLSQVMFTSKSLSKSLHPMLDNYLSKAYVYNDGIKN